MRKTMAAAIMAAAVTGLQPAARAAIVRVETGPAAGGAILFDDASRAAGTIMGRADGGTRLVFAGTTCGGGTLLRAHGGAAPAIGGSGSALPLTSLSFSRLDGGSFDHLAFSLAGGDATSATIALTNDAGQVFSFTSLLDGRPHPFGFAGTEGEAIRSVSMTFAGGGVANVSGIRLDPTPAIVPEPAGWALMILGVGFVGYLLRRPDAVLWAGQRG